MSDYPAADRQNCGYAIRYLKWLCDSGVALEIGPDALAVVTAVVTQEDEIHYSRAVNFYNEQLMRRSGIGSEPALIRARKRAIEAEILVYVPGAKRRPGRYFTTGFTNDSLANPKGNRRESEEYANDSLANPSPSIPYTQLPNTHSSDSLFSGVAFEEIWEAYPRRNGKRVGKDDAQKAFAKIAPADHAALLTAVRNYASGVDPQYVRDCQRFLKNNYWRDWVDVQAAVDDHDEYADFPGAKKNG